MDADYWWEPPHQGFDENYRHALRDIIALRPPRPRPCLFVLGNFEEFRSSALWKAAARTQYFAAMPFASASAEDLRSPLCALIKWAPGSAYQIDPEERRRVPEGKQILNDTHFNCRKEVVLAAFQAVASYSSAVDPLRHVGPAVVKSNVNAAHDGMTIMLPTQVDRGDVVYERLLDNSVGGNLVYDIRVPFVLGVAPLAYVKFRRRQERFQNVGTKALLVTPADVLTSDEVDLCRRFCVHIGLDYGELDVIRDRKNGRIYIIDANNTAAGPPKALSDEDRMSALRIMALTFCKNVFGEPF